MSSSPGFGAGPGASLTDLVSTLQNIVKNGGGSLQSLQNVFPPATSSTSPVFVAVNNLGTTGTTVMNATTGLSGLIVHNPGTATAYLYSLSLATTPTLSALGGTFEILPAETVPFPSIFFANINIGFGAFASAGTTNPLTLVQFF